VGPTSRLPSRWGGLPDPPRGQGAGVPETLSAFAEVVWANERGCGLRYLAMKDEDAEKMRDFIEKSAT
jgi:hypothetical protein